MRKRIVCLFLGLVMMISETVTVLATTEADIKAQKSQAESQLNETNAVIDDLSEKQQEVQAEIDSLDLELVDMMIRIDAVKSDISLTESNIETKEGEISNKESEITQTEADLAAAEEDRDQQYADMKTRIRYIYENGGEAAWFNIMLSAQDITTMLNRAEYAQSMHNYDRQMLTAYIEVVNQVTELKASLETQKADLETQKADLETQKVSLEAQKADLEVKQNDLQVMKEEKKAVSADYEARIATAEAQAAEITSLIAQQEAELARIAEERRAAEEAARREAEEAARREAERQQELQNSSNSGSSGNNSGGSGSVPGYSGSGSGASIVAYAKQFVGNPYVWGGNSLTNGIDCSHFVWQVLRNCGVYSGGYATSAGWRTLGNPVGSLSQAQAGDVICYSGHVAIYDGNGRIVEAQSSSAGITCNRSVSCSPILAIRRFV
ncbi:MAG: NlpC/P60 family protein [Lachnospiraceae bacterium]|nr:NlpC/P60 family protein [Lachnospiraceae bacterium]